MVAEVRSTERPPSVHWVSSSPYRILFPVGLVLAALGAAVWLAQVMGLVAYPLESHSRLMTRGFLTAIIFGFLLTMLPRRTETEPPARWEVWAAGTGLLGFGALTTFEILEAGLVLWLGVIGVVGRFAVLRLLRPNRRPPDYFVWLWWALLFGILGTAMGTSAAVSGDPNVSAPWLVRLGEAWVKHGMLLSFVFAASPLVVAVMCRGKATVDGDASAASRRARRLHHLGGALLATALTVEVLVHERAGLALRGLLTVVVLGVVIRPWPAPSRPGLLRWAILTALWCLPLGPLVSAAAPAYRTAGMHLTYLTGFGLLAIAAGSQLALGHEGMDRAKLRNPWPIVAALVFVLVAGISRQLVQVDPTRFGLWLWLAAGLLFAAVVLCTVPFACRRRRSQPRRD